MPTTTPHLDIRRFLEENMLFGDSVRIGDDDSLLSSGVLDSTGVIEVIAYLEERYGITLADSELTADNLDSINRIAALVARKTR